ncbi:Zn(II)2Cys6 transcription factor domain-containing protein [Aspergillus novofumigatus IBT 16806]|uniref:Zn(2)-C6 fungal-type domain-containing protein n=1 Tax=Aspergillus novofumigatus (strain IBT 16806) TaxID=1392255 RepID=A0A2I1BU79_ASPN1|nr:uncharacterized protein P174DRAFT_446050 [Aspergillus novofumigatus IBT 16806]PKX88935.1 hypothetical protein P174DRAFT_446050 [Aspergillus novofumigatus IBT 16806]
MPSRRSHTKSRNGCGECKRRRVKCNEQYPCHNCLKNNSDCIYGAYFGQSKAQAAFTHNSLSPGPKGLPTFPRMDSVSTAVDSSSFTFFSGANSWLQDLELMHHFSTVVYKTLASRKAVHDVWGIALPREAYSCECLMHGLLALSASHLATLSSQRVAHYTNLSASHLHRSLCLFRVVLADISVVNCIPAFALSSLLVIQVCAQPILDKSRPTVEKLIKLFNMCRGVGTILAPYGANIQQSSLSSLLHDDYNFFNKLQRSKDIHPTNSQVSPLARLRDLIKGQTLNHWEESVYFDALSQLEISFDFIQAAKNPLEWGMAFVWPVLLKKEFLNLLGQLRPLSLVMLSHYCVLLYHFDHLWFLNGWAKALLTEIGDTLTLELQMWIDWPREVCGLRHPRV